MKDPNEELNKDVFITTLLWVTACICFFIGGFGIGWMYCKGF
jgi:hypothetical protein